MAKLNRKQIQESARRVLEERPGGIRWSDLLKTVHGRDPETPYNSVHGGLHALLTTSSDIVKVARGTYQLAKYVDADSREAVAEDRAVAAEVVEVETEAHETVRFSEADFYQSFAQWLIDVAEDANEAVSLGGSVLRGKWGTPDVIGVLKPRVQDLLKFEPQIVAAEIKIDPGQPVVAFGQAVAYRLFSHKSYIVVPNTTSEDDLGRLKALCTIHGLGLVTFTLDPEAPDYSTHVLPTQASPDMFYTNQMLRRLLEADSKLFNKLF
ncbi:MAG: hypothetical protein ACK4K7_08770 [Allosphingosinicella sp.]|uniref:hypothetical protein n=1 Tax=Allosphingosinicella sp. TaxID=2823234 RepID=UPI003957932F